MFEEYVPKQYGDLHSSSRLVVKVSAVHQKVKGSIPGADKGILDFFRCEQVCLFWEHIYNQNSFFFEKLGFFFKIKFWDINRYAQIYTDMSKYV